MVSIHDKSKTCFVFPDGEGGWLVKMTMPNGKPLEFELSLSRAADLQAGLATAISDLARKQPGGAQQ